MGITTAGVVDQTSSRKTMALASIAAIALAVFVFASTLYGAYRWYSPVPYWDMWDGYIRFFTDVKHGHWREFFSQANEHRDVLARLLFWFDIQYFGGRSLLLIPINIAFMVGLWAAITASARHLLNNRVWPIVSAGVATLCFSWLQSENVVSGYQGVFFAAYLFPLLAFQALAVSASRGPKWFVAALALGFASLGTMANGVLALPLILVMFVLMPGASVRTAAAIVIVYAAGMVMWLHRYRVIPHDKASIADMVTFVGVFLGSPFERVSNSIALGSIAGFAFLLLTVYFLIDWIRNRRTQPDLVLALVMFCGYVCAAAIAAASGRASAGVGAALAGRYATPALLGWAAMTVLVAYHLRDVKRALIGVYAVSIGLALALLPIQAESLSQSGPNSAADKMTAALAIRLGIDDQKAVGMIYPVDTAKYQEYIRGDIDEGARFKISIFDYVPLNEIVDAIGKPETSVLARPCFGSLDVTSAISADGKYVRTSGWAFDKAASSVPSFVLFVDSSVVVGAAVVGKARPDVASTYGNFTLQSGYSGYMLKTADPKNIKTLCLNE